MGIIIVIILLAILGFYAFSLNNAFKSEFTLQEKLDRKVAGLAKFKYVQRTLDCDATKAAFPTCPPSGYLRLSSNAIGLPLTVQTFNPTDLSTATQIGDYYVRAACKNPKTADNKTIYIEASPKKVKTQEWKVVNQNVSLGCSLP